MTKKLMLLAMSIGALVAFAVPAMASAATGQLTEGGKSLAKGATFLATSTNTTTSTSAGPLFCTHVELDLTVSSNSSSGSTGSGSGSATGCTVEGLGIPVTITKITVSSLSASSSGGKGTFAFTYDAPLVGLNDCTLTGTNIPFTWTAGTSSLHLGGALVGSGSGCPTSGTISGDYKTFTPGTGATPIVID